MDFRIADTFTDSLARLTGEEQKAVKTTAFDLQLNPTNPGMSFHRLDKARDKNFWSVRVGSDIRLVVHRTDASLLLCYVDHHDRAYAWAERRKLETHPRTGAAQLVEIRETVREVLIPAYVTSPAAPRPASLESQPSLFANRSDDELLSYGVPPEWIADVRRANEDSILALADHLPAEAAEALLELATGGKPRLSKPSLATATPSTPAPIAQANPFDHPDAQRRFRVMSNSEELLRALEFPWDRWTIFLHPEQRQCVERDYNGPARVSGSAGTGKTIVALHRAVHLTRVDQDARVLLTTFSDTLASSLRLKLRRLVAGEPRLAERIDVYSLHAVGSRLYSAHEGKAAIASQGVVSQLIHQASDAIPGHKFSHRFLIAEWNHVVDEWQLVTWDGYRDVARLGRKTRIAESQRKVLWSIFERVWATLKERELITEAQMFTWLASKFLSEGRAPFDYAVVDEAQDIGVPHLRFLAAIGGGRPNALFFAGDLGQRIFQQPFSWKALGVDVRGRSLTLRVNYRTSHQIRTVADRLLGAVLSDVDSNEERRSDTTSVFNGPVPEIRTFANQTQERQSVADWMKARSAQGVSPHEFGVFVRSEAQLGRAKAAVDTIGLPFTVLDDLLETVTGHVSIGTMPLAKGLEFRAVVVMACDDEVVPLQERIESVGDGADLQEVYDTERQLLYVACTRARDFLLATSVEPASEFFDDLRARKADLRPAAT